MSSDETESALKCLQRTFRVFVFRASSKHLKDCKIPSKPVLQTMFQKLDLPAFTIEVSQLLISSSGCRMLESPLSPDPQSSQARHLDIAGQSLGEEKLRIHPTYQDRKPPNSTKLASSQASKFSCQ